MVFLPLYPIIYNKQQKGIVTDKFQANKRYMSADIIRNENLKNKTRFVRNGFFGSPKETRTPDFAVRGRRLNRLTMRPYVKPNIF